ncbi:MAG TPA: hypothetical protein VK864_10725, partial [Longimicrobiales bacterium]|nr:hypothetical protein [Longimicrobiales bacterium]
MNSQSRNAAERGAISQELSEFLIEFSVTLHRVSMYPWGHPSLEKSAANLLARMVTLFADRTSISIGVAKRQLIIEGVATDPEHPVLRGLAEKLHRHHLGALVIHRGARPDEIVSMMRLVGLDPERDATPLGLGDPEVLRQWHYVRLYPLTYEQLELLADEPAAAGPTDERDRGTRSAQLWIGLARAALALEDHELEPESTDPGVVAQAINAHPAAKAYDQVIVGYLLQLAQELKQDGGSASATVRRRLSRLIGALDEATLRRLIEMGGDLAQRKRFVLDASEALAVDAIVELVQAAAASTNQSISNAMVRLLTKLSAFAEKGPQQLQAQADVAVREQIQLLMADWTLDDPNPDAYTRALESLATRSQSFAATAQTHYPPEPVRVMQMAFEVDSVGVPFWRAVAEVLGQAGLTGVTDVLDQAGSESRVSAALWSHLATPGRLREFLADDNLDFRAVSRVVDRMQPSDYAPLLMQKLVESESRAIRLAIFKRLAAVELSVLEPMILEQLQDERWYVQRNMLALLNEKNAYLDAVQPAAFARHSDPRVRREALQLWMRSPLERDRAMCSALADSDERTLRAAVAEAARGCPDAAVPLIVKRLQENQPADLRAQLVRLLDGVRSPAALDALVRTAAPSRTLL